MAQGHLLTLLPCVHICPFFISFVVSVFFVFNPCSFVMFVMFLHNREMASLHCILPLTVPGFLSMPCLHGRPWPPSALSKVYSICFHLFLLRCPLHPFQNSNMYALVCVFVMSVDFRIISSTLFWVQKPFLQGMLCACKLSKGQSLKASFDMSEL